MNHLYTVTQTDMLTVIKKWMARREKPGCAKSITLFFSSLKNECFKSHEMEVFLYAAADNLFTLSHIIIFFSNRRESLPYLTPKLPSIMQVSQVKSDRQTLCSIGIPWIA